MMTLVYSVLCAGDVTCHSFDVTDFLASTLLQRHKRSWRAVYWKENIGRALFPSQHPGYSQLQSGVLCSSHHRTGDAVAISF
jgi:hypothetical protein